MPHCNLKKLMPEDQYKKITKTLVARLLKKYKREVLTRSGRIQTETYGFRLGVFRSQTIQILVISCCLFCRGWLRNVERFKSYVLSYCSAH